MSLNEDYQEALRLIEEAREQNSRELNLDNLELTELPFELFELINLRLLNLDSNKLRALPNEIASLENLTSLSLNYNRFQEIPSGIFQLNNLNFLGFHNNNIGSISGSIEKLEKLTHLEFGQNLIQKIPKELTKLANLNSLDLSFNLVTSIPKGIGELTKLSTLYLFGNKIKSLPKEIGNLKNLYSLQLDLNKLTSLPKEIGQLKNLYNLRIASNKLKSLPKEIGQLSYLNLLDLGYNSLTAIPLEMREMRNLHVLVLKENKFELGKEILELPATEQIHEILKWQKAQKAGTLQPIHEAKVIFIGESNYGKTHLIEFIKEGEIKREIRTTHGIERSQIKVSHNEKEFNLNIWDLGGQEFMRSTHQFFFSERTLYVLVSIARRERNELNHWLKLVNQLGNNAPVLVVINKIDLDKHDLDRQSIQRDYPNITFFVRTCIFDCDEACAEETLKNLRNSIIKIISDPEKMPSVFEQRPPEWFAIKNELEKLEANGRDFITYQEYENLEFIKDLPEEDRKSNLKLLSMIGSVVSFVDDPRLIDTNVINPQWIMDGVYAIINDHKIKDETKGQLHIDDLERILSKKKFPKARHAYLLELMKKFNLCYAAKDQQDIYFIPDLFEDIEPEVEWKEEAVSISFRYNYKGFSPDVFMTRFIVEMHQDIIDEKRWRSGVYISNGSCHAKVYQTYRENYINIEVTGTRVEERSYLYAIRETFRKLHQPFPQMEIKQEVLYKEQWLDFTRLTKLEEKNKPWYHEELDEDLPITAILNGYSTSRERMGNQQHLKIFLASSSELKEEREQFEIFINRENQRLYKQGIFIELQVWENAIDAMSLTRLQDRYNQAVKHCDIFISLFFTKVGKYTLEEFETAFGKFKETGKPLIYTYFKNAPVDIENVTEEVQSLLDFRKKLDDLGHFRTVFKTNEDLQLQFKNQLDKILP